MKNYKALLISSIILTASLSLFSQKTIRVCADGSRDFKTITEAMAYASKGDIIEICGTITNDGIEYEGIVIDKDITIRGESTANTFVEGSSTVADLTINKRVFTINPGVMAVFENFTIRNGYLHGTEIADKGAGVDNHGRLILKNCVVQQNFVEKYECLVEGGVYNEKGAITAFDTYTPQNAKVIVSSF